MASNHNHALALEFVQDPQHVRALVYATSLDCFFLYQEEKGYYKLFDEGLFDFDEYLLRFLIKHCTKNVTTALVRDVKELIKILCYRRITSNESDYIALKDKLLCINDFSTIPFDPEKLAFFSLPTVSAVSDMPKPDSLWLKFLNQMCVKEDLSTDNEIITLIQEMFGYSLLPTTRAEKTFFLVGEGSNGKSVLLNILRAMVGERNCGAKSIEKLTTNDFATSGLVGKMLNVCSEEESDYIKSDKFKAIVSGEYTDIEKKFGHATEGKLIVKFIFATNDMPTFSGFNHALLRRMIVLPFLRKITDEEKDVFLTRKILNELSEITTWALAGAQRLVKNGYRFSSSIAAKSQQEEFQDNLSSAISYVRSTYEKDAENFISNEALYEAYKVWADNFGVKKMKYSRFCKDLSKFYGDSVVSWDKETGQAKRGRNLSFKTEAIPLPQTAITF